MIPRYPTSPLSRRNPEATLVARICLFLFVLSLGSCRFLVDEFSMLDHAGPVAEPQIKVPSPIDDRS